MHGRSFFVLLKLVWFYIQSLGVCTCMCVLVTCVLVALYAHVKVRHLHDGASACWDVYEVQESW